MKIEALIMRLGDIDGKGVIYDDSGQMLVHDGDCLTKTQDGLCVMDGPGCFAITNLRTVFIREPKSYPGGDDKVAKRLYSMSDGQYWPDKADKAKEAGAKEFFEVLHDEVKKIKHGSKDSSIFVEIEGEKHKIVVDNDIAKILQGLLKEGGLLK